MKWEKKKTIKWDAYTMCIVKSENKLDISHFTKFKPKIMKERRKEM